MLISVIGAHGTGKTTAISKLHNLLNAEGDTYIIINETTRHCPFHIGKSLGKQSLDWTISTQRYFEDNCLNMCSSVITDRNMIDQYAYYIHFIGEDKTIENELINRYSYCNHIFLMPLNPAYLVSDGLRPIDLKFQEDINSIILHILDKLRINVVLFNENSINEIIDMVRNYVPIEHLYKKVTKAEYNYDNKIFEKLILTNNLSLDNLSSEHFDKMFYKMIIQSETPQEVQGR
jgi:nicotinamide riboside kinase